MEQNIKLNINVKPNTPRINTIDVLANARPVRLKTQSSSSSEIPASNENSEIPLKPSENIAFKADPAKTLPETKNIDIALKKDTPSKNPTQPQALKTPQTTLQSQASRIQPQVAPQPKATLQDAEIKPQNPSFEINKKENIVPPKNPPTTTKIEEKLPPKQNIAENKQNIAENKPLDSTMSFTNKAKESTIPPPQKPQIKTQANAESIQQINTKEAANKTVPIEKTQNESVDESEYIIKDEQIRDIYIEPEMIVEEELTLKNPNIDSLKVNVEKLDFHVTRKVRVYLKKLINCGGSDLHLKAGAKIRARVNGDIIIFSDEVFSKDDAITFAKELTRTRYPEFVVNKEMDMTYIYDLSHRFRVNMFFQMDGVSFAFRAIPTIQNTIDGLGLPQAIHSITNMERGLVLVTGITGSGKSTTLASIINEINHNHAKHIITIEDPIEFIHKDMKSIINQRSVGMDTNSFAMALKAALREDPDIILVGEMRDIETIEMALHAAETGHLVLSTLHTLDAKETINRIISVFPASDQVRIRATLASTLNAIVSQRLLKTKTGGRTAAVELLFRTPRIELIISENRDSEIIEALAEGKDIYHTQTFDQHLFELIVNGVVDEDTGLDKATSPSDLKLKLQNINFTESNTQGDTITIKE